MTRTNLLLVIAALGVLGSGCLLAAASLAETDGSLLTGTITETSGRAMEGVTVSARVEGQHITTSVFTDYRGNYYFPKMGSGRYQLWAQAIGYEGVRSEAELNGMVQRKDFVLKETKDFTNQLTGGQYVAALPLDSPAHRRMRDVFVHDCTTCHTAAFALQNRFDEKGWVSIITLMSRIDAIGTISPSNVPPEPRIDHYKQELAAYLAEMRGPGKSPMEFQVPSRPTGDATLPVIYEYGISLETGEYTVNDGSDWSFGTPSNSSGVRGVHDASIDLQGNIWLTYPVPSVTRTYGKIDTKTGEVTNYAVPGRNGMAAGTHGITRGPDGYIWVNVSGSAGVGSGNEEGAPGSLGRIDPKTGKIEIYTPPKGMAGVGGFVDWDGKGFIWGATSKGAVRFDPRTGEFKEFLSVTQERLRTYGVAGDRDGVGWWAEISIDKVGHSDAVTGKSLELTVPPNKYVSEGTLTPEDFKLYEDTGFGGLYTGAPWRQGPRRLAADKNGDEVWVCLYAGNNLLRINTHTLAYKIYPMPPGDEGPYEPAIDNSHNVWIDIQGSDAIEKRDPRTGKWTRYDWPTRGAAPRNISLLDQNGEVQVLCAYYGTSGVGRMVIRTRKELQTIEAEVRRALARNH